MLTQVKYAEEMREKLERELEALYNKLLWDKEQTTTAKRFEQVHEALNY